MVDSDDSDDSHITLYQRPLDSLKLGTDKYVFYNFNPLTPNRSLSLCVLRQPTQVVVVFSNGR